MAYECCMTNEESCSGYERCQAWYLFNEKRHLSYLAYTLKQFHVWRLLASCGELWNPRSVGYDAEVYEFILFVMHGRKNILPSSTFPLVQTPHCSLSLSKPNRWQTVTAPCLSSSSNVSTLPYTLPAMFSINSHKQTPMLPRSPSNPIFLPSTHHFHSHPPARISPPFGTLLPSRTHLSALREKKRERGRVLNQHPGFLRRRMVFVSVNTLLAGLPDSRVFGVAEEGRWDCLVVWLVGCVCVAS